MDAACAKSPAESALDHPLVRYTFDRKYNAAAFVAGLPRNGAVGLAGSSLEASVKS